MTACRSASVIIPTLDGRKHLEPCLAALRESTLGEEHYEVLVVDNGARSDTETWLQSHHPGVRYLPLEENLGFTGAVAAGVAEAEGESLVLLNDDTRADPGWLERLLSTLDDAPSSVATVTGQILSWEGEAIDFWRGGLTFDGHAFQLDFGRPRDAISAANEPAELPFPCGAGMAVRRRAWESVGGFDGRYFAYLEDVDFGWRAWLSGHDHLYEPRAQLRHRSGSTGVSLGMTRRGFLFERNAFATVYKNLEDELFRDLMPVVLWTLLHRTWSLLELANADGPRLRRYPFPPFGPSGPPTVTARRSLAERLRGVSLRELLRRAALRLARLLGEGERTEDVVRIDDPRSVQQLRAVRFLLDDLDDLAQRRRAVQGSRRRSDREYFERFPLLRTPTYPGDEELFRSAAFRAWFPRDLELDDRELDDIGIL